MSVEHDRVADSVVQAQVKKFVTTPKIIGCGSLDIETDLEAHEVRPFHSTNQEIQSWHYAIHPFLSPCLRRHDWARRIAESAGDVGVFRWPVGVQAIPLVRGQRVAA